MYMHEFAAVEVPACRACPGGAALDYLPQSMCVYLEPPPSLKVRV